MVKIRTPRGPIEVEAGPFADRVKEAASAAGLTKFRVFIGDSEISDPESAPAELTEEMDVTIFPYDVGA